MPPSDQGIQLMLYALQLIEEGIQLGVGVLHTQCLGLFVHTHPVSNTPCCGSTSWVPDRAGSRHAVIRCTLRPITTATTIAAAIAVVATIASISCHTHTSTLTSEGELEQSDWVLLPAEATLTKNTRGRMMSTGCHR